MHCTFNNLQTLDFSFGSNIFSVEPPVMHELWNNNTHIFSESPFIVEIEQSEYNRLNWLKKEEEDFMNKFLNSQPESKNPEFLSIVKDIPSVCDDRKDASKIYAELGKFRFKNRINELQTYEEKKDAILDSDEWKLYQRNSTNQLLSNEITKSNINEIVEKVGEVNGEQLRYSQMSGEWINLLLNKAIFKVYISDKNIES